jgi:hypothetical protein
LKLEPCEDFDQCEEVRDSKQAVAICKMDIGLFLCQRGTA